MRQDLSILFYSSNQKPEPFASKIRAALLDSIGDLPLFSITHKPLDFGETNYVYKANESNTWHLYRQILIGASIASTRYIAMAEDDCLYPAEHYQWTPPRDDTVYYNKHRWWIEERDGNIQYRWRDRTVMSTCICNRELLIEALEARFRMFPDPPQTRAELTGWGEVGRYEWYFDLPKVKMDTFRTQYPLVTFNTRPSLGGIRRANPTDLTCGFLEPWGFAEDVWEKFVTNDDEIGYSAADNAG